MRNDGGRTDAFWPLSSAAIKGWLLVVVVVNRTAEGHVQQTLADLFATKPLGTLRNRLCVRSGPPSPEIMRLSAGVRP